MSRHPWGRRPKAAPHPNQWIAPNTHPRIKPLSWQANGMEFWALWKPDERSAVGGAQVRHWMTGVKIDSGDAGATEEAVKTQIEALAVENFRKDTGLDATA